MSYKVVVTREGNNWLAEVPGMPGGHTYAGNLISLDDAVREVIALMEDLPEGAEAGLVLDWDFTQVDTDATEAVRLARRRRAVDKEKEALATRTRELVLSFRAKGWSVRDIAGVLGVTPGRVSQLV